MELFEIAEKYPPREIRLSLFCRFVLFLEKMVGAWDRGGKYVFFIVIAAALWLPILLEWTAK